MPQYRGTRLSEERHEPAPAFQEFDWIAVSRRSRYVALGSSRCVGERLNVRSPHLREPMIRRPHHLVEDLLPVGMATMDDVTVSPVRSRAQMKSFIECEYTLGGEHDSWIPPLRSERRRLLSRRRNPFLSFGEIQLYIAQRGKDVVGRIAAIDNPRHNRYHGGHEGFFGLVACVDDEDVTCALFDAVDMWLAERGMTSMLGPVNFSTNYECGLLVDGFDSPPTILMPWNPSTVPTLLERIGFKPAQDLLSFEWPCPSEQPRVLTRVAAMATHRGITVRPVDVFDFEAEVGRLRNLYNRAWQHNWGFVPLTEEEFRDLALQLLPVVRPELTLVAEIAGDAVGFCLTLPDVNPAILATERRRQRWRLPFGPARIMHAARTARRGRLMILGVVQEYQNSGALAVLAAETDKVLRHLGYESIEIAWVLQSNKPALRALRASGCKQTKKYRIYQRDVGFPAG